LEQIDRFKKRVKETSEMLEELQRDQEEALAVIGVKGSCDKSLKYILKEAIDQSMEQKRNMFENIQKLNRDVVYLKTTIHTNTDMGQVLSNETESKPDNTSDEPDHISPKNNTEMIASVATYVSPRVLTIPDNNGQKPQISKQMPSNPPRLDRSRIPGSSASSTPIQVSEIPKKVNTSRGANAGSNGSSKAKTPAVPSSGQSAQSPRRQTPKTKIPPGLTFTRK
jgi:hypothetical protein